MTKAEPAFKVGEHFVGKAPIVRATYNQLLKTLERFGPVVEEPKKTSIHLVNTTALAGIVTRKEWLVLTIKSDHPLASTRVHKTEQTSARRFHHEIKLTSPLDVDDELIGWLERAYTLSA